MNATPPLPTETALPDWNFHRNFRLLTWHPVGVLDDALLDRIVDFLEWEEKAAEFPFDRYTDFDGLTQIQLQIGHIFQIAEHHRSTYEEEPVKSAFFCDRFIGHGIARLYQELMVGAPVEVRVFWTREAAAEWLQVPISVLTPGGTGYEPRPGDRERQ